jgi:hypothetical protein
MVEMIVQSAAMADSERVIAEPLARWARLVAQPLLGCFRPKLYNEQSRAIKSVQSPEGMSKATTMSRTATANMIAQEIGDHGDPSFPSPFCS